MRFNFLLRFRQHEVTILRVHGGKSPTYLDYFNGEKYVIVLVDQLQSEQGVSFLHKRNRNIFVEIDEDEELDVKECFSFGLVLDRKRNCFVIRIL